MGKLFFSILLLFSFMLPPTAFACSGAGSNKHIGMVTAVNNKAKTFTIKDAETNSAITFEADDEILSGLKGFKGRVMVSYEEDVGGDLKATGVTF